MWVLVEQRFGVLEVIGLEYCVPHGVVHPQEDRVRQTILNTGSVLVFDDGLKCPFLRSKFAIICV